MNSFYKVGGSLDESHLTYIKRQADKDLYENLIAGNFCYVLTSRQMGKSSLRVRVMKRLEDDGFSCSSIDLTEIGSHNITASEWYYAMLDRLIVDLKLTEVVDLDDLWAQYQNLAPLQRLNKFVTTILFTHVTTPIVIFVDEIDSIIDLKFDTDDFFAWIRYCYNFRTDNLDYKRLTFCLLGVATPTDLIKNKSRTSYNIGESIEPLRFQESQLDPLMEGLREQVTDLARVQSEIYKWTGGQPLLAQRLCQLIQSELGKIESGQEEESISKLVESKIIENWEYNDEPVHLKTIRDRLLKDEDRAVSLLGLYQQILAGMESKESIEIGDNLSEVMALRLTGLVVSEAGKLFVYNQIYQRVFSAAWVAQELAKLRPYAVSLVEWLANNRDDKYLLTGQGFLDSQQWSLTRRLTQEDSQYLAASQKLHTENFQAQADEVINKAKKRATLFSVIGVSGLIGSVIASGIAWTNFNEVTWRTRIEQASTEALSAFSEKSLERTIAAIRVGRQLQQKVKDEHINNYPTYSPLAALRQVITNRWYEKNRFSIGKGESILAVSADAQKVVYSSENATATITNQDGSTITKLNSCVTSASISADGQTIVSSAVIHKEENTFSAEEYLGNPIDNTNNNCRKESKTIKVWRIDGSLITNIKDQNLTTGVKVSKDGQTIISGNKDGIISLWTREGSLINSFKGYKHGIAYLNLSVDGQNIISCGNDDTTINRNACNQFKLWKRDGSIISTIQNPNSSELILDISINGKIIITSSFLNKCQYNLDDFGFGQGRNNPPKYSASAYGKTTNYLNIRIWRRNGTLVKNTKTIVLPGSKGTGTTSYHVRSHDGIANRISMCNSKDKKIQLFNQTGSLLDSLPTNQEISNFQFSANGQIIISNSDGTIKTWQKNNLFNPVLINHKSIVSSVGISADGQTIISGSNDKTVKLWSNNGSLLRTLIGHKDSISSVAVSADGQTTISGSSDQTVKLWSNNGSLINSMTNAEHQIHDVGISGDGKTVIFNNGHENIKVKKTDGSDIATIKNDSQYKLLNAMSMDGKTIISAAEKYGNQTLSSSSFFDNFETKENKIQLKPIKIWRQDGTLITTLTSDQNGVNSVAISADGQIIIAGIDNGTVKVWRRDGTLIKTIAAHQSAVNGVAISADGQTIVSGSSDNLVKVWRQDGTLIATLTGHKAPVTSVGISGDGKTIVSGSYDKTVRVWHFDLDYLLAKGCEQIEDYLNSHPKVNREELCPASLKGKIAR